MIVAPGVLAAPAGRLLSRLAAEGRPVVLDPTGLPSGDAPVTLAIGDGPFVFNFAALVAAIAPRPFRVLLLSRLGAHPDARTASLQRLWRLEEHVRGGGAPTLTLRFAPIVGPDSPLWCRLRRNPPLGARETKLVTPVAEEDAMETLRRALDTHEPFDGWWEVAGPDAWTLGELRELARSEGPARLPGAWEPELEEIAEHRLAECGPWAGRFGITPRPVRAAVRAAVA